MQLNPGDRIINTRNELTNNYGTAGGVVKDGNGNLVMLTCFHCVFTSGMFWTDRDPNDTVSAVSFSIGNGYTSAGFVEQTQLDDRVDMALVRPTTGHILNTNIPKVGKTNGLRFLGENDKGIVQLKKYGATTNETTGVFDGFIPQFGAIYPGETSFHYLDKLIKIISPNGRKFADQGDSGALVLDEKNRVAGVIVMVGGNTSYAIQAGIIETRLNVTFI
ncbi:hypothetical protein A3860_08105 [Niastella vici]|uniref:Peptidase S1 domain-containing protein n=1 Tax=Niastella vici TaxID=1703345 RepID=A0A1V9FIU5_9BACT|nr:hypothetical protein [Niastella vici]OQP58272.1 hypothetical protein A3860_08105 [Niastella vici]